MRNFPVKNRRTRYGPVTHRHACGTATPGRVPERQRVARVSVKHRKQSGDTQQQSVHDGHNEGAQAAGTTSGSRLRKRHTPSVACPGSPTTGAVSVECSTWGGRSAADSTGRPKAATLTAGTASPATSDRRGP